MKDRTQRLAVPTMRHVAERAGVSSATVSLVLRGDTTISERTRERVLQAQKDLGYTVNRFAQQFVRRTRRSVENPTLDQLAYCLLGVTFDNTAYAPFLHGIVRECQAANLHLFTQSLDLSTTGVVDLASVQRNGNVDGIIVTGIVSEESIATFRQANLPFLVLGNYRLQTPVARVEMELQRVGCLLAREAVARGYRLYSYGDAMAIV